MNYIEENFHKWIPNILTYPNKRYAIGYCSIAEEGYPEFECAATVNIPDEPLEDDEVIIKDYSENEGIYNMMVAAGHISPAIRYVNTGFVTCPICKLLIK